MQNLKTPLDAFLKGEDKVAVIKGGWGVGKTYFWDNYINQRIKAKDLKQIAYSYISLFGKTSLSDVRKSIFHSIKPISSDVEIKKIFEGKFSNPSSLLNLAPWMGWVAKNAQNIPYVGNFSNMISSIEYSLVDNYIICFDDLERKADTLAVKEVMGLIDELATRKNCKVILIFNEKELDENASQKEFDSYREKVVDIELNYEPTCVENIKLAFPDNFKHLSIIKNVVNELDIKNIRVLRKIYRAIEEFCVFSKGLPDTLIEEFITHAMILCRGYFIRSEDLPYETIKSHIIKDSWMLFAYDKEKEGTPIEEKRTPEEKKYIEIAINLKLSPSYFDEHIIHYLEQGFVNEEELKSTVSYLLEWVGIEQFKIRLNNAWDIYTDSFEDNYAEFIGILENILKEDMDKIEVSDFDSIINAIERFKEDGILDYIENYVELHKESLKNMDLNSLAVDMIKNKYLKEKIYKICKENKPLNIDGVTERIAEHRAWNTEDVDFLSLLDKEYFRAWMKSNPKNLVNKIRRGLFIFRNSGENPSQEKVDRINSNVKGALLDIASENDINKRRVKYIYGVE